MGDEVRLRRPKRRLVVAAAAIALLLAAAAVTSPTWAPEAGWRFARSEITVTVQCNGVASAEGWYSDSLWSLATALPFSQNGRAPQRVRARRGLSGFSPPHVELAMPDGTWRRVQMVHRDRRLLVDRSPTRLSQVACDYT